MDNNKVPAVFQVRGNLTFRNDPVPVGIPAVLGNIHLGLPNLALVDLSKLAGIQANHHVDDQGYGIRTVGASGQTLLHLFLSLHADQLAAGLIVPGGQLGDRLRVQAIELARGQGELDGSPQFRDLVGVKVAPAFRDVG